MKRTIFLFSLMVCFAMGLSAQNIVGKWQTDPISEEEGQKMVAELTFGADKVESAARIFAQYLDEKP